MGSTSRDASSSVAREHGCFAAVRLVISGRVLRMATSVGTSVLSALFVLRSRASRTRRARALAQRLGRASLFYAAVFDHRCRFLVWHHLLYYPSCHHRRVILRWTPE